MDTNLGFGFVVLCVGGIVALVSGWILALPTLLPVVRGAGRSDPRIRLAAIFFSGLLAVAVVYGLTQRIYAGLAATLALSCGSSGDRTVDPATGRCAPRDAAGQSRSPNFGTEVWLRMALPFQRDCYTDADTCAQLDRISATRHLPYLGRLPRPFDWSASMMSIIAGLFVGAASMFFSWHHTRPEKVESQRAQQSPSAQGDGSP